MTATEINPKDHARFLHWYLSQGEVWFPNGKPKVQIADMDLSWRRNAANWLVRRAASWEHAYIVGELIWLSSGLGGAVRELVGHDDDLRPILGPIVSMMPSGDMACDAFEREQEARADDPAAWIKTTALYRALVVGAGGAA